jgi:glyoxylase-like metal-dependent hydrolase (beta-lactamase superfamily II)
MDPAPGIVTIDTRMGGIEGATAAYLVTGVRPALVDTGPQTSAATVLAALAGAGLGPGDLAWLVLTHVHLDHAGAVGDLAEAFPDATVVVHPRGARHVRDPARLVAGSMEVYRDLGPLYGGMRPVPESRVLAADDGARVPLGGSRHLLVVDAPGHAHHHMALLDETTGTLFAGDALGVRFPGSGLYPAVPPPQFDRDATLATLERLRRLGAERVLLGHYGSAGEPEEAFARSGDLHRRIADAALTAYRNGGAEAVGPAVDRAALLADWVGDEAGLARWRLLRWGRNNVDGLVAWARDAATAPTDPEG